MVNNSTRDDVKGSICSKPYHFVFEWNTQLPPTDAFVKVYMQSRDNHFTKNNSIAVNASISLQVTNSIAENKVNANNKKLWTFLKSFYVEKNSSSWLMFEITEQLAKYWDTVKEGALVDITLKFDVNCEWGERLPMKIIHSVALTVHNTVRRKMSMFQPFLVISTGNIQKAVALSSSSMKQPERRKRYSLDHICLLEDFRVNFPALGIRGILRPTTLNIRQCIGSCSINYAPDIASMTTNHARLMTSATATYNEHMPSSNRSPPKNPCCSPISYYPAYLLQGIGHSYNKIHLVQRESFIVKECGCR